MARTIVAPPGSSTLAFAGVAARVRLFEVGDGQLRVVLQGVEVLVAEEFLHVPEVRAAEDQLGGATAAEGVPPRSTGSGRSMFVRVGGGVGRLGSAVPNIERPDPLRAVQ